MADRRVDHGVATALAGRLLTWRLWSRETVFDANTSRAFGVVVGLEVALAVMGVVVISPPPPQNRSCPGWCWKPCCTRSATPILLDSWVTTLSPKGPASPLSSLALLLLMRSTPRAGRRGDFGMDHGNDRSRLPPGRHV